jgi:hypothetical protein
MAENRTKWPPQRNEPVGHYAHPDGTLRSDRSLAGPLRLGTAPGVGPSGFLRDGNASDFGMDRVSPRGFDPIGTSDTRAPAQEASTLLSRETRTRRD